MHASGSQAEKFSEYKTITEQITKKKKTATVAKILLK